MPEEATHDPENYRAMCVPHESQAAAEAALAAFLTELGELRKKHRIRDLTTVLEVSALSANGREGHYLVSHHHGDILRMVEISARAFARAQKDHEQTIAEILADPD